jgi:hypothetical protein
MRSARYTVERGQQRKEEEEQKKKSSFCKSQIKGQSGSSDW